MTTPVDPNWGYIVREDESLKVHLQGITVTDANSPPGGRPVKVYFRLPEQEAQRREYPYITIDMLSITRDPTREYRGTAHFSPLEEYQPPGRQAGDRAQIDYPIPTVITYQITSHARFVQHDRQILAALVTGPLREHFGSLLMVGIGEFPSDHSIRRLDIVSGPTTADQPDPADPNKRIFRKAWTVQVSSEMFAGTILHAAGVAPDKVLIDVHQL